MPRNLYVAALTAAAALAIPVRSQAQNPSSAPKVVSNTNLLPPLRAGDKTMPSSEDQYPGFVQLSGKWVNRPTDTDFAIDCGYAVAADGKTIVADVAGNDFQAQSWTQYGRYRRIGDTIVVSAFSEQQQAAQPMDALIASGVARYAYEILRPNGAIEAKDCRVNSDGVAQDCKPATPFLSAADMRQGMSETDARCKEILSPAMLKQMDTKIYSRPKADAYKKQQAANLSAVLGSGPAK